MELYLFFHEVNRGMDFDTLYKFKLPSLPISSSLMDKEEEFFSPILKIPKDKYPNMMGCVQLDSKLYFFGGHHIEPCELDDDYYYYNNCNTDADLDNDFIDITDQFYSRNVYVFDLNADDQGLKRLPSLMATGKPRPCGFVANGMIYVLGGSVMDSFKLSNDLIKRFERFNPVDGKWEVLDDSPLRCLWRCVEATVIDNQYKVLITGWKGKQTIRLVYDFLHDRWDSDGLPADPSPYSIAHIGASDCNNGGGGVYLYGLHLACGLRIFPFKLGPLKELDHMHELSLVDMSTVGTPEDWKMRAFFRRIAPHTKNVMCHLGDGHFCYVVTGTVCYGDDSLAPCPHTRKVSVTIFKELSSPVVVQEEGACSFEAQILCVKDYFMKMESHGSADLAGCFFIRRDLLQF